MITPCSFPLHRRNARRFFSSGRNGLLFLFLALVPSHGSFGFHLDGTLDKKAISLAYFEGDFERILPPLEEYRDSFPASATKDDSIFVYKYLSVIYAADSSTRQKGESCMVQLIKMKPKIELIDMYISDNIKAIFKDVKASYFQQQKYIQEHDVLGNNRTGPAGKTKSRSKQWVWWTAGGVGAGAVAMTLYFVLTPDSKSAKNTDTIKP